MVRNKQQLLQAFGQWMNVANQDMVRHLTHFMQKTNVNVNTLAEMLDENPASINAALQGNVASVPLSLFAKILIATGHVIAIMPEGQVPNGGANAPRMPRMPRDARGRFMSPNNGSMPNPWGGAPCPPQPQGGMMPPMGSAPFNGGEFVGGAMPMNGGFPMPPRRDGMLPSPEELDAMIQEEMARNGQNVPEMPLEERPVVGDAPFSPCQCQQERVQPTQGTAEDPTARLANALRNNPEIAQLLGQLLAQG